VLAVQLKLGLTECRSAENYHVASGIGDVWQAPSWGLSAKPFLRAVVGPLRGSNRQRPFFVAPPVIGTLKMLSRTGTWQQPAISLSAVRT
jgi:hypothetical protein